MIGERRAAAVPGYKDVDLALASVFLIVALPLTGGGSGNILGEFILKIIALGVISYFLSGLARHRPAQEGWLPVGILAVAVLLALCQLVPLPAALWHALPGRDLAGSILDAIGRGGAMHSASLDPGATLWSLTGLLPALAMLIVAIHFDARQRWALAWVIVACALVSLIVATVQLLSAGRFGVVFDSAHRGYPTGLFANRNHQATLLMLAIPLCAGIVDRRAGSAARRPASWLALGLVIVFAAGVVATKSRAGLLLLPLSIGAAAIIRYPDARRALTSGAFASIAAAVALATENGTMREALHRLSSGNMDRLHFWADTMVAIHAYWPVGAGLGTFVPVFQTVEPLDHVGPFYVNHAHNDYLELLLEGGAPTALLLLLGLVWLAFATSRLRRFTPAALPLACAGLAGVLILMAHSCVDYPERILSIQAISGALIGFLTPVASDRYAAGRDAQSAYRPDRTGRRRREVTASRATAMGVNIGIGNPDARVVLRAIDAELPIRAPRVIISERNTVIEDLGTVAPDPELAHHWAGRELPDPMSPLADLYRCGPSNDPLRRCRGEALGNGAGDDSLYPLVDLHLEYRVKRAFGRLRRIVDLANDQGGMSGAAGDDILIKGNGCRLPERKRQVTYQFCPFERAGALAVIIDPVSGMDDKLDAAPIGIMSDCICGWCHLHILDMIDVYATRRNFQQSIVPYNGTLSQ